MQISDKWYDRLKYLAIIGLPALAVLYQQLAAVWNFPGAEQVPATLNAVQVFLGTVLCISAAEYRRKGTTEDNA